MTNYIILVLCVIIILSYLFDITGKYSRIPGVILLIIMGIVLQLLVKSLPIQIPNLQPLLPVIGTIGLVLIVLDASLDLKLERRKKGMILKSIASAFVLFVIFSAAMTLILTEYFGFSFKVSLLNAMPLGIISSAIAIPASSMLKPAEKEFMIYESSFSDIFGIILFDFILLSEGAIGNGIIEMGAKSLLTIMVAGVTSLILAALLHKITYHINYVLIMTSVILIYTIGKIMDLPSLLLVMIFGLILSNNHFLENDLVKKYVDFPKFRTDVRSFNTILTEFTFLVRSFFFIIFGFYVRVEGLFEWHNLITAGAITVGIFLLRLLFFVTVIKMKPVPLALFAPRGLITILLFISIPAASRIFLINEEVITLVILLTIFIMTVGNMAVRGEKTGGLEKSGLQSPKESFDNN
ncbi:MAG: cation:proton antiporter [Bacteroidales bacterium]|jgi:Kef-type K+ transport system membrane component KefB|nr:cation:proton antiporter [Bacteroidales bacterium]